MQRTMPGACRRGRPRTAWMDNINTWTGLPVKESVRMTEDRDKWRKYVHSMANSRLKNRTEQLNKVISSRPTQNFLSTQVWFREVKHLWMFPAFQLGVGVRIDELDHRCSHRSFIPLAPPLRICPLDDPVSRWASSHSHGTYKHHLVAWHGGKRRSLAGELSLSCTRPVADG